MEIKASDVKALREKTGAGMLDCKNALVKAEGNFERAEKLLKEQGLAAAAKRSGKATNEGRIFSLVTDQRAGLLELSCETDFVARNQEFIDAGTEMLARAVEKKLDADAEELTETVQQLVGKIKENLSLKRITLMERGENELIVDYLHGEGQIGVLVKLSVDKPELLANERVREFAFDCALHIAAFNPFYLSRDKVAPEYLAEQESIFRTQAAGMDKPEKVIEGIIKGKLNKHLSEVVFLEQGFVKEEKSKVESVADTVSKDVGGKLTIVDYAYFRVGEQ